MPTMIENVPTEPATESSMNTNIITNDTDKAGINSKDNSPEDLYAAIDGGKKRKW